ncbi:amidohydrolase family protein [Streptomyces sp. MN03-5084-2B]|nr:amidohydrolase family protein [Streptomyces sp. MN03-5084-2B]
MTTIVSEQVRPEETPPPQAPVIDTDVHEMISGPRFAFYIDEPYRSRININNWTGVHLPYTWPTTGGIARPDTISSPGTRAGSDYQLMREQHLDRYNVEHAVLTGLVYPTEFKTQPDFATAIARGYNNWLMREWLRKDERFLGSMHIAAQDPVAAVAEIDRVGPHPRIVQIMLPAISHDTLGREFYHPVYEAAVRHDLAVGFHHGTTSETAVGLPPFFLEWHTAVTQAWQSQLISLVAGGVFEKFPTLRVVMVESSWTWLPHLMWRFDQNYRALRREVPWVKRLPSEYIREQVKFTTQPMEYVENPRHMLEMFEMVGNDEFLMFSSDYPHWDSDSPERSLPSSFPAELKRKVLYDNAAKFYRIGEYAK